MCSNQARSKRRKRIESFAEAPLRDRTSERLVTLELATGNIVATRVGSNVRQRLLTRNVLGRTTYNDALQLNFVSLPWLLIDTGRWVRTSSPS